MEQRLKVDGTVWVKLPYGEFVIDEASDAVLLAGGTGISAFMAFIEALKPETPQQIWLIQGARNPELLLFRKTILAQLERVPNFHAFLFSEVPGDNFVEEMGALVGARQCFLGRISLDRVWSCILQPPRKVFYLSGPPAMLTMLTEDLRKRGVPPAQIRTDAWE
jgi:ferredoxin-NADP reductase